MARKPDIYLKKDMVFPLPTSVEGKILCVRKYLEPKIKKEFSCGGSRIKDIETCSDGGIITLSISARVGFTLNNIEDVVMGLFDKKFEIEPDVNNDKNKKKFTIKGTLDEVVEYIREHDKNLVTDVMQRRC